MNKPVGTVMYRDLSAIAEGKFEVAVHTTKGWVCVDQDGPYPFTEPNPNSPWPWTQLERTDNRA
ncbi:hypothetical protein SEA_WAMBURGRXPRESS_57 [Mycobacterium phage Wamburgrxpress]|uniref:Uncharacterized protein n=2 Tax=Bronvirus TaxID=1623278 RepID=A0A7U0J5Y9_9CAUD|nr:hypothetical protein KNV76_gp055 [Mycobacterium phage OhShagHennessy]AYD82236.1 hypothetical protein SEA_WAMBURGRXPRESS_57 [Mycobacterium phage Wamburgrxpress]QGJ93077.1 hypothetical protein SEA_ZARIA_58 [Mycobacterium phage Zaria]QQV92758.1 hypothetical protein SEA_OHSHAGHENNESSY_55 [Mycobacterium phage OhShagHennessy]WMI34651.1 hypothetical protein SEA_CALM_58 [Mycobacterium phage Calm]